MRNYGRMSFMRSTAPFVHLVDALRIVTCVCILRRQKEKSQNNVWWCVLIKFLSLVFFFFGYCGSMCCESNSFTFKKKQQQHTSTTFRCPSIVRFYWSYNKYANIFWSFRIIMNWNRFLFYFDLFKYRQLFN